MSSRILLALSLVLALTGSNLFAQSPAPEEDSGSSSVEFEGALDDILELLEDLELNLEGLEGDGAVVSSQVLMLGPDGELVELDGDDALEFLDDFDWGACLEELDLGDLDFDLSFDCEALAGTDPGALPDFEELFGAFNFSMIEESISDLIDELAGFDFESCFDFASDFCLDGDFDFEGFCGEGLSSGMVVMGGDAATFDWTGDFSDLSGFGEGGIFGAFEEMFDELDFSALPWTAEVSAQAYTLGPDGQLVELDLDAAGDLDDWLEELLEEIEESCAGADGDE